MKSLIWLNTIASNGYEWDAVLPQVGDAGFTPISFRPDVRSFDELFYKLNKLVLSAQKDQVCFVAYSWSAYLALTYLSLYPDHVERIFLINPLLHDTSDKKFGYKWFSAPLLGKVLLFPWALFRAKNQLKKLFSPYPVPKEAERKLRPLLSSPTCCQQELIYRHIMTEFPLSEEVKSFPVPIRVLFGQGDQIAPYAAQLPFFQSFVNFSYKVVEHAGHALPWTHADLIAKELRIYTS